MLLIGLTGGIGSGKSTVSEALSQRGYPIVDADAITRELQEPGQPVLIQMVEAFGSSILLPDGRLDRAGLARRVFPDPDELAALNSIVHPAVGRTIAARLDALAEESLPVILDVPLLVESGRADLTGLIVVDIHPDLAVERLTKFRDFDESDARARIARQADREQRRSLADWLIDNNGTWADLHRQIDLTVDWLRSLRA